ncbi:hypothetical protein D3C78_1777820 [compost metagenome]
MPTTADAGGAAQRLVAGGFRLVQIAITKRRVQGGNRQAVDQHAQLLRTGDQIARFVGGTDGDGQVAIAQDRQVG